MASYSFRKDLTFPYDKTNLIIILYVVVRNTNLVWRAGWDMGEGKFLGEGMLGRSQSVTKIKQILNPANFYQWCLISNDDV